MEKKPSHSVNILKPVKRFFKRFHLTLFFVFIIACLSGAVLLINNTLQQNSSDPDYTSSINAGSIDEATLTRLKTLHPSEQGSTPPALPSGRLNPFSE